MPTTMALKLTMRSSSVLKRTASCGGPDEIRDTEASWIALSDALTTTPVTVATAMMPI